MDNLRASIDLYVLDRIILVKMGTSTEEEGREGDPGDLRVRL